MLGYEPMALSDSIKACFPDFLPIVLEVPPVGGRREFEL
jgi:hypothetical protein